MHALFKSGCVHLSEAEKDVYYRLKNNPAINWRSLLMSFAKRFNQLSVKHGEASQDTIKCFIVERLWGLFLALLRKIVELFEIDIELILEKFFKQADFDQKIMKILRALETENDKGFDNAA